MESDKKSENDQEKIKKMSTSKEIIATINRKLVKCSQREMVLSGKVVEGILTEDKELLKSICKEGFPDDSPILRALVWKILLNYLPMNHEEWGKILTQKRKLYYFYKEQFTKIKIEDYEKKYYKNINLLEIITKDVNRTHMSFNFFFQPTCKSKQFNSDELQNILKIRQNCVLSDPAKIYKLDVIETHAEVLERMLFIYAKLNPEIAYKQGMNEILAVLYYCLSYDKMYVNEYEENIEADTFWCFYNLMDNIKSSFDNCLRNNPIRRIQLISEALLIIDKQLYNHFKNVELVLDYYCNKWFILFFSQDYVVNDILRLWDILFTEDNKFYFVYYAGLAILEIKRDILLNSSMFDCIIELQKVGDIDIESLISTMFDLRNKYDSKIHNIFDENNL